MNSIETIICLMLLLMAMPDLCKWLGRPALANIFFVLFGLALEPLVKKDVNTMIEQAGEVGFLLVLFEVGLEIELPKFRELIPSLRFGMTWWLIQYPIILALACEAGLTFPQGMLAAAALSSCSMSMAYFGLKHYPGLSDGIRSFIVQIMIVLEVLAIVVLSVGTVMFRHGFGWLIFLNLAGIAVTIYLISRFSSHVVKLFQWIIFKTTHWRVHFLVLLVLVICAIGDNLGLSAPKTAFFLGMVMGRTHFEGKSVAEYISPISQRFLIPLFFLSLGMAINPEMLFSLIAVMAICGSFLLIGFRELLHRRFLKTGADVKAYLLLCPNLTMAALAAKTFLESGKAMPATWVVLVGLFMSLISLLMLPRIQNGEAKKEA